MENLNFLRWALLVTAGIYFIFDHFDQKQTKDEREELIRLKTFELVHKATVVTLCIVAVAYLLVPEMNALYPLLALMFSFFYTEIIGKLYFRRKF